MLRRKILTGALGGAAALAFEPALAVVAPRLSPRPNPAPERPGRLLTRAPNAVILDAETGETLYEKAAERAIPPASMTKLMTLYLVFEALAAGELTLAQTVRVSRRAARAPGSSMLLRAGETVRIDDLIRGAAVQSGNDAAITLAEAAIGSEPVFARAMTRRAQELGFESARFENATGLPSAGHRISVHDLARLGARVLEDFPERAGYFAERDFAWAGVRQQNRNPLLGRVRGVDGLKTGHTREAGYCIVLSALRDARRVVIVLAGLDSEDDRAREARRAVTWAFERL